MTQTNAAAENFGRGQTPRELIEAMAEVKMAVFAAIQKVRSRYTPEIAAGLQAVLEEIRRGDHDGLFILPLSQGGAGTSLHYNINEVLFGLLNERTGSAYDAVEEGAVFQSTNDVFPTAVRITLYRKLESLEKRVISLQEALVRREQASAGILLTGRTEGQDALPMDLSQVFSAWAGMIERDRWRLCKLKERLRQVPLGGTAIGTCFFAPRDYVYAAEDFLRSVTGLPLCRSQNLPDAVAHHDEEAELSGGMKILAGNLLKMTEDFLYYTSSRCREMIHPALQYGSTIMPAKVNPVLLEFCAGLCFRVISQCDLVQTYAFAGRLQLNPYLPFMLETLLQAFADLDKALVAVTDKFLVLVKIDAQRMQNNLYSSPALLNVLRPLLGYEKTKQVEEKLRGKKITAFETFIDEVSALTGFTPARLSQWLDKGHITGHIREAL